jgi:transposase-like protein
MNNTTYHAAQRSGRRFWQAHVKALAESGFSRSEYCRRHNLSYHALTYWVRKQGSSTKSKPLLALVEVPVRSALPVRHPEAALRLHLASGRMLEIEPDFDQTALDRILTVLERQR